MQIIFSDRMVSNWVKVFTKTFENKMNALEERTGVPHILQRVRNFFQSQTRTRLTRPERAKLPSLRRILKDTALHNAYYDRLGDYQPQSTAQGQRCQVILIY